MRRSIHSAAFIAAIAGLTAATGVARAGTFICVPATAGAAVTSGGPSGTCSAGTPVELPASRADQQTMVSVLPYLSFKSSGIGGKPTVAVRGANLQITRIPTTTGNTGDGTGNLVVGGADNYFNLARTGSENLVLGHRHGWTSNWNLVAGEYNRAGGSGGGVLFGKFNELGTGFNNSVLGGSGNMASGGASTVSGGRGNVATRQEQLIGDGDVYAVRVDERGQVTTKSEPGINAVDGGVGMTWVEFPGVNANGCTAVITPIVSGGGTVTASRYRSGDGPWVLVTTTHQDKVIDTAFDMVLSC